MTSKPVIACCHTLLEKKLTIAFAESVTTGKLVYEFTSVPNCGDIIKGSIVCYDRSVKENLMGIPSDVIDEYSAESPEVTKLLAHSVKQYIPADIIAAVTGLASPGGSETPEKPVGTIFLHFLIKEQQWQARLQFEGSPDEIIRQTIDAAASILLDKLTSVH